MKVSVTTLAVLLGASLCVVPAQAATIIDDFTGGVTEVSHPEGAGVAGTYYDITNDSFAGASAGTLDGDAALKIDDGGFTNGVYAIYEGVVTADGLYTVSADMHVNETEGVDAIRAYQIGVIVNGEHRGVNPSDLATVSGPGTAIGNYVGLTENDDSALPIQSVVTSTFAASAGDNLLIAFSTDLDTGDFDSNAGTWGTSHVLVDNIMLNVIPEPSSLALIGIACFGLIAARRRGA